MVKAFELFSVHAQLAGDGQELTSRPNSRVPNVDEHESDDENVDGSCLLDVEDSEYSDEAVEWLSAVSTDPCAENSDDVIIDVGVRLPCIAHTLQLALKDGINDVPIVDKILKESNAAVVFFSQISLLGQ